MAEAQYDDGLSGLAPIEATPPIGIMPNAAHQNFRGFMTGAVYELAIVEFDDQGLCYDRAQMDAIADRLDALRAGEQDVILYLFVHGWKHDARTDDTNLTAFRSVLAETVRHEQECHGEKARPVLGIFVGWRGLSTFGPIDLVADTTFWGRQAAAHRVATGSVRELFGRLRHYRNHRLAREGAPLLAIAGHSFGGMIVFSALAQSLIEAASAPLGELVPSLADLVLLVNPALEGARYLPIQALVESAAFAQRTTRQLPVFVCVQGENDQPVGTWFPVGNVMHRFEEATIGRLEKQCVSHALGFIPEFRTHRLTGPAGGDPFVLDPPDIATLNPFWVAGASKEVIDGHGGIWQRPFIDFLTSLLFQHVEDSKRGKGPVGTRQAAAPATATHAQAAAQAPGPTLASYARRIRRAPPAS